MNTKLGWQLLGRPPERFRALCGGSKGIKIVGNEDDLTQLRDWYGKSEILEARLITAEQKIVDAKARNDLEEIPVLAAETAELYAGVAQRIGLPVMPQIWWEIPPIMPEVNAWTALWYAKAACAFKAHGLKSVVFGFATGTPQSAPWAGQGGNGPDEWPQLYDCLEVLDTLGVAWVRIGVEEYITNGRLVPGDRSNLGRIIEVYERHIKPNGWNIVFRGVETGYDLPAMWDAGITPYNLLGGNIQPGQPSGGLWAADSVYAALPYVDCMYLYAVCDPTNNINESRFAFTPGEPPTKHNPTPSPGHLEAMQGYFDNNKPIPFVPPGRPPVVEPPSPPAPLPEPTNLLVNGSFEGPYSFTPDDQFGDRKIPSGWSIGWNSAQATPHVELDQHPARVRDGAIALRIWSDRRFNCWFYQRIRVDVGATYVLQGWATGHRLDENQAPVTLAVAVDTRGGQDFAAADFRSAYTSRDEWRNPMVRFTATQPEVTIFVEVRTGEDGRGDGWHDAVALVKEAEPMPDPDPIPVPEFPAWYRVDTSTPANPASKDRLRLRRGPGGEIVGLIAPGPPDRPAQYLIEKIVDGWAYVKGTEQVLSAQFLVKA